MPLYNKKVWIKNIFQILCLYSTGHLFVDEWFNNIIIIIIIVLSVYSKYFNVQQNCLP